MEDMLQQILKTKVSDPGEPWKKVGEWSIGGMRALGYSDCSRYLLVETSDGRGLFDCRSGKKIFRDRNEYQDQELNLLCNGIGPIENQVVRMAGLHGGGLPLSTRAGWTLEVIGIWPKAEILLFAPGSWLYGKKYGKPSEYRKIWSGYEIRGCGFSYTGETLVIGESSDLVIYSKVS